MALSQALPFDLLKVGQCRQVERIARRDGRWRVMPFPALVGLLVHPDLGPILFDTGYATHFWTATRSCPACLYARLTPVDLPAEEHLGVQLAARGLAPEDIRYVVLSHFHADHIAGLRDLPNARILGFRAELDRLLRRHPLGRLRQGFLQDLCPTDWEARFEAVERRPRVPLPKQWSPWLTGHDLLGDGSLVGLDLPGHAGAQLGLAFLSRDLGPALLVGDATWSMEALRRGAEPSALAQWLFPDRRAYRATFAALRALATRPGAPHLIPSHCLETWEALGKRREVGHA